jgi:MEDS: MEthanogen/methylotroph, DcmR Sensory domain
MDCEPSAPERGNGCHLVIRKNPDPSEVLEFVVSGLEVGQQIVALAGPDWLKELGRSLSEGGLRSDILVRTGRVIFLTAPDCFAELARRNDAIHGSPLRLNGSIVRWISDWSWAYNNGTSQSTILNYQRHIHNRIRQMTALSLCTVHCSRLERSSMLKMLVHHRHAIRAAERLA